MLRVRWKTCVAGLVVLSSPSSLVRAEIAQTQSGVADLLRHGENQVRSMTAVIDSRQKPTPAENVERLQEVSRDLLVAYVLTPENAEARQATLQFERKKNQERRAFFSHAGVDVQASDSSRQIAYDGELVRVLGMDADQRVGIIETPEQADWSSLNEDHPYSFVYEFQREPYSELVAQSPDFRVLDNEPGQDGLRVYFQHPRFNDRAFVLVFDDQGRMVEREEWYKLSHDAEPTMHKRYELLDYKSYPSQSGELIHFPTRVTSRFYATDREGNHIEA